MIIGKGTKDQNRQIKYNSNNYEWVKIKYSQLMSESNIGNKNHFYGKTHTEESRRKIGAASKGRPKAVYTRKLISKNSTGTSNGMALEIQFFNNNDEYQFSTHGNFLSFCKNNNMPTPSFQKSYRNNGMKLYQTPQGIGKAKQRGFEKYIGWYALKSTDIPLK